MAIEPERIRVDLMKLKRKIYLSYPYDSRERKDFLLKNKLNEISFLTKLVPEETATHVFDVYKETIRFEVINIILTLCAGGFLSALSYTFHQFYPKNAWFTGWFIPLVISGFFTLSHVYHIVKQWNGIKPFKASYAKIQEQIKKLKKDTKNLE